MGLLFIFSDTVWPQETKQANPRIKELQQQRLAVLGELRDVAAKLFMNARAQYDDVHAAERELLAARIAYADTQKDRIKACDAAIQSALEMQKVVIEKRAAATGSAIGVLKVQAFLLELQITRESLETGP